MESLKNEVDILHKVDHPHIAKYFETYDDAKWLYLCMELCQGGELFEHVIKSKEKLSERKCAQYFMKLLMKHPAISQHISEENLGPQTSAPQNSEYTVTSVLQSLHSGKRIELMNRYWAQRYRSYLRDGRVGSFLLSVNPFHHGCSFVFSFVAERSRAGSAS